MKFYKVTCMVISDNPDLNHTIITENYNNKINITINLNLISTLTALISIKTPSKYYSIITMNNNLHYYINIDEYIKINKIIDNCTVIKPIY